MEGQRREDRRLGGRVEPFDVGRRVGLGVAQRLGLLDGVVEAGAGRVHLVEDVVGRAVDDAEHAAHVVAGQRLAQRPEQRDRAGDRRLVVEVDPGVLRRRIQGGAVLGEQRLVGGDDGGAVLHRAQDEGAGRFDAPDDLDDDVSAGDQVLGVRREEGRVQPEVAPVAAGAAHRDADDVERAPDPGGEVVAVLGQQPGDGGSHDAAAEQRDAQRFVRSGLAHGVDPAVRPPHRDGHVSESGHRPGHPTSRASRSSTVSRRTRTRACPSLTATTGGRGVWLYWLESERQ